MMRRRIFSGMGKSILLSCTSVFDRGTKKITFTARRSLPEGYRVLEHGIIITDSTGWQAYKDNPEEKFVVGASKIKTEKGKTTGLLGNYTASLACTRSDEWYGKGYVKYCDPRGAERYAYSSVTRCRAVVEDGPAAQVIGVEVITRDDGKADVRFMGQLTVPEGYVLNETGLLWYNKSDLQALHDGNGGTGAGVKTTISPKVNLNYQFSVTINGVPGGKFVRGVIFAKMTDNATKEVTWAYSPERKAANEGT